MNWSLVGCVIAGVMLGGCSLPAQRADFASIDPQERTLAIGQAASSGDQAAASKLIQQLSSDDPATRMLAIAALAELTGETKGYDYAGPEPQRREAVERWEAWQQASAGSIPGGRADEAVTP